ncbi:MAG: hypothetical protein PWQ41_233 [Bacillota bacterium]|nr:hypothetical protein [Bacillota bacterium]MDK2855407.1 hypothetical protein [Bacillota bacterium]MDK2924459.1 hypothetical protein [Bacillota bacterium]
MGDLAGKLAARAVKVQAGGQEFNVLPQAAEIQLAQELGMPRRELEVAALKTGIVPGRYLRNMGTVGLAGQLRLLNSTVAVVGCGGLGGLAVELLARMGVGTLVLIDGDVFEDNNLNRQILCTEADLGKPKVMAAYERALAVNAAVEVRCHKVRLTKENAASLLKGANVVVDALDNLPSRFALEEAARELNLPLVHGAIAGFLGQVLTVFPGDPGLAEIYGPPGTRERGVEVETGNPAATPALVASFQVQEVVKLLTGIGEPLRRRLLYIDSASGAIHTLSLGETGREEKGLKAGGPKIVSFVGASGSGKTTLIVEVIAELVRRGLKVAAIKHSNEAKELDQRGKDTWRFHQAGAQAVAFLTPSQAAVFCALPEKAAASRLATWFCDADLVLVEGYKSGPFPKIAVFRPGSPEFPGPLPGNVVAAVGDVAEARATGLPGDLPVFGWTEVKELSDFLLHKVR